ncbi:MAG: HAD-IC family P-type ATPase [Eubacteriaceae bacterium]
MNNCDNLVVGLSQSQVEERIKEGKTNVQPRSKTKTVGQIIKDNTLTLFNLLNIILALLIIFVESYQNLLFLNVVIINTVIGIVQEVKAKKTVDKLSLLSQPLAKVIRDGTPKDICYEEIVIDDVILLSQGKQIPSDSEIVQGKIEVNESLLTGESEPIIKRVGDKLLSGSFVISGEAYAQVQKVGLDNYANNLANQVKTARKPKSEIMKALNFILKVVGICIIPIGLLLLYEQIYVQELTIKVGVVGSVAALIGMIPEGLILLTSVALAVSVIRLGRHKTLVQELYCIETLAQVDVLCLDKTGTITEGSMEVLSLEILDNSKVPVPGLRALVANLKDDTGTFRAVSDYFKGEPPQWDCEQIVPFSSNRKWSGANFGAMGTYVIGAPEFILGKDYYKIKDKVECYAEQGNRVMLVGYSDKTFLDENTLPEVVQPIALLPIGDKIRHEAKKTLDFFRNQGVAIKVMSGDNPVTVSQIAKRAGLLDYDNVVDASMLKTPEEIEEAALRYSVFGRVAPDQKKAFIKSLKSAGHTVAMTGDGVNDVLALKEADCSIAMAEGSDVTRQISQLVLLNSDFSNLTRVLMEGRRVINNIRRAASLFLVKTIFSFLLSIIVVIANGAYPFAPIQLTLISTLTIGIPSFFLALEPNKNRVTGNFLETVLSKALPGGLTIVLNVVLMMILGNAFGLKLEEISTIAALLTGIVGLVVLFRVSQPMDNKRWLLFFLMTFSFAFSILFFSRFFSMLPFESYSIKMFVILGIGLIDIWPLFCLLTKLTRSMEKWYFEWKYKNENVL